MAEQDAVGDLPPAAEGHAADKQEAQADAAGLRGLDMSVFNEQKLRDIFDTFDADGSGEVSIHEITELLSS